MSWKYSDPLSGALIAAAAVTNPNHHHRAASDIGLGSSSLYRQYYSGYDPLISRYETRRNQNLYRPTHVDLLDDIEDLTLEMEAENLFGATSRRTNISSTYVPTATTTSLFTSNNSLVDHADKATATSFIEDDETRNKRRQQAEINHKASQIPKQPPPAKTNNAANKSNNHGHQQQQNHHGGVHNRNGGQNGHVENHPKQPPQPKQVINK